MGIIAQYTDNKKMAKIELKLNSTHWAYAHAEYDWTNAYEYESIRDRAKRKMDRLKYKVIPRLERKIKRLEKRLDIVSAYMV